MRRLRITPQQGYDPGGILALLRDGSQIDAVVVGVEPTLSYVYCRRRDQGVIRAILKHWPLAKTNTDPSVDQKNFVAIPVEEGVASVQEQLVKLDL